MNRFSNYNPYEYRSLPLDTLLQAGEAKDKQYQDIIDSAQKTLDASKTYDAYYHVDIENRDKLHEELFNNMNKLASEDLTDPLVRTKLQSLQNQFLSDKSVENTLLRNKNYLQYYKDVQEQKLKGEYNPANDDYGAMMQLYDLYGDPKSNDLTSYDGIQANYDTHDEIEKVLTRLDKFADRTSSPTGDGYILDVESLSPGKISKVLNEEMSQQGLNQLERNYNYYYSDKYPDFDSFIKAYIGDIANANAYYKQNLKPDATFMDFAKHGWEQEKDKLTGGNFPLPKLPLMQQPDVLKRTRKSTSNYTFQELLDGKVDPKTIKNTSGYDYPTPMSIGKDLEVVKSYGMTVDPELYLKWESGKKGHFFKNPLTDAENEKLWGDINELIKKGSNISNQWFADYSKSEKDAENQIVFGSPGGGTIGKDAGDYMNFLYLDISPGSDYTVIDGPKLQNDADGQKAQILGRVSPFEPYTALSAKQNPTMATNFSNGRIVAIGNKTYIMTSPIYQNNNEQTITSMAFNKMVSPALSRPYAKMMSEYNGNPVTTVFNPDDNTLTIEDPESNLIISEGFSPEQFYDENGKPGQKGWGDDVNNYFTIKK